MQCVSTVILSDVNIWWKIDKIHCRDALRAPQVIDKLHLFRWVLFLQRYNGHMNEKFNNKYRIKTNRLPHWDYGSVGAYFITICSKNRLCYFGEITNAAMHLSEIGKIVKKEWIKSINLRPDMNLQLGAYIVMPNHFHAIIFIGENTYNTAQCRDALHASRPNQFGSQSKNLAAIIRGFKSSVTRRARKIHANFAWQSRYYEHIIGNQKSYDELSEYIKNNPLNWQKDSLYQSN